MKTYANGQIKWNAETEAKLIEMWNSADDLSAAEIGAEFGRTVAAVKTRATVLRQRGIEMRDKQSMPDVDCLTKFTLPDGVRFQDDPVAVAAWEASTPRFYPLPSRDSGHSSTSGLIGGGRLHGR